MTNIKLTLPAQKSVLFVLKYPSDYIAAKTRCFKLILFRTIIYLKYTFKIICDTGPSNSELISAFYIHLYSTIRITAVMSKNCKLPQVFSPLMLKKINFLEQSGIKPHAATHINPSWRESSFMHC